MSAYTDWLPVALANQDLDEIEQGERVAEERRAEDYCWRRYVPALERYNYGR